MARQVGTGHDFLSPSERSLRMGKIRSTGTKPELAVREVVENLGIAYVSNVNDMPGRPDLVFPQLRKVILVNGCFWHGHEPPCTRYRLPTQEKWLAKLHATRERDARNVAHLRDIGWDVLVVWECEITPREALIQRIARFLATAALAA